MTFPAIGTYDPPIYGPLDLVDGGRVRNLVRKGGSKMRAGARVVGVVGAMLVLIGAAEAVIVGRADTAIVGSWMTVGAAIVGIAGGILVTHSPVLAAWLMALAAAVAALVAPGVIPAIADQALLFVGYLTGGALLLVGAILAFVSRKRVAGPQST